MRVSTSKMIMSVSCIMSYEILTTSDGTNVANLAAGISGQTNYVNFLTRQNKLRIVPTFEIFMRTHVIHFPMGSNTDHIQVYLGQNGILKSDFVLADM